MYNFLGSTGAAPGVLHPRPTYMDAPCGRQRGYMESKVNLFSFSFLFLFPIQADSIRNCPCSVWFCPNKKMKKKDLLPKDLWKKKMDGEEERSATKWFVRKKKKEKKERRRRWWCGDVVDEAQLLAATIETLYSGTFKKEKFDDKWL